MNRNAYDLAIEKKQQAHRGLWENLQYAGLALTIIGQIVIGPMWLLGQILWAIANVIAVSRDFALTRPLADKVKDIGLTALTLGLIVASFL